MIIGQDPRKMFCHFVLIHSKVKIKDRLVRWDGRIAGVVVGISLFLFWSLVRLVWMLVSPKLYMFTKVFLLRFWRVSMCPKNQQFGMINIVKVKNKSAFTQQKCWFAEKNQLNGNRGSHGLHQTTNERTKLSTRLILW